MNFLVACRNGASFIMTHREKALCGSAVQDARGPRAGHASNLCTGDTLDRVAMTCESQTRLALRHVL